MSSSESSSSEDEEENSKIREAIIPDDLLLTLTSSLPRSKINKSYNHSNSGVKPETEHTNTMKDDNGTDKDMYDRTILHNLAMKFKKKEERIVDSSLQNVKSNRPDKMTEPDHSAFHATTPGFRAHIEKRLLQILDSDIQGRLVESVWKKTNEKGKQIKGIKLFSDVHTLCLGEAVAGPSKEMNVARNPPKIIPRKRKLNSSSSESSDEEDKINSCIFTVDDIMHENRMIEDLSKSRVVQELSVEKNKISCDNVESQTLNSDGEKKNEKEKNTSKKKQKKEVINGEDVSYDSGSVNMKAQDREDISDKKEVSKKKKKKREMSMENPHEMLETSITTVETQSDEPVDINKKKKKKKRKLNQMIDYNHAP